MKDYNTMYVFSNNSPKQQGVKLHQPPYNIWQDKHKRRSISYYDKTIQMYNSECKCCLLNTCKY